MVLTSQEASRPDHWKLRKIKKSDPNIQTKEILHFTWAQLELLSCQGAKAGYRKQQKSGMLKLKYKEHEVEQLNRKGLQESLQPDKPILRTELASQE